MNPDLRVLLEEMGSTGLRVERKIIEHLLVQTLQAKEVEEEKLKKLVGRWVKYTSSPEVSKLLFDELGLPRGRFPGTSKQALAHLDGNPIVAQIRVCQGTVSMISHLRGLSSAVQSDGRARFSFVEGVTFRLYTKEYNVIGIRKLARRACLPDRPKMHVVSLDWSAAEFIMFCRDAEANDLVASYARGDDIHRRLASELEDVDYLSVTPEMRKATKNAAYSLLYGSSVPGKKEKIFDLYPEFRDHIARLERSALHAMAVVTVMGDVIPLDPVEKRIKEQAVNYPYQASVARKLQNALVPLTEEIREMGGRMWVPVYDCVVFQLPDSEDLDQRLQRLKKLFSLGGEFQVTCHVGPTWGEVKRI